MIRRIFINLKDVHTYLLLSKTIFFFGIFVVVVIIYLPSRRRKSQKSRLRQNRWLGRQGEPQFYHLLSEQDLIHWIQRGLVLRDGKTKKKPPLNGFVLKKFDFKSFFKHIASEM